LNHLHFSQINSTQSYLLDKYSGESGDVLISCDKQIKGHGQYGREWDDYPGSLSFSFTLSAHEVMSLTSLEVGCLIHQYFKQYYNLTVKLKWPNDILTNNGHKVGGILINNRKDNKFLVVGIGLNYFSSEDFSSKTKGYTTPYGYLFDKEFSVDAKAETEKIYKFILDNRFISEDSIIRYWTQHCFHLYKSVTIIDADESHQGVFTGIGSHGQAILEEENGFKEFFTGSVIIS